MKLRQLLKDTPIFDRDSGKIIDVREVHLQYYDEETDEWKIVKEVFWDKLSEEEQAKCHLNIYSR